MGEERRARLDENVAGTPEAERIQTHLHQGTIQPPITSDVCTSALPRPALGVGAVTLTAILSAQRRRTQILTVIVKAEIWKVKEQCGSHANLSAFWGAEILTKADSHVGQGSYSSSFLRVPLHPRL